jgi:hypothetical protein
MKTLISLFALSFSLQAFSAEHIYWVESLVCEPNACFMEIANDDEHMVLVIEEEFLEFGMTMEELEAMDVSIDKKDLKRPSKKDLTEARQIFDSQIKVYKIHGSRVTLLNLQNDD